MNVELQKEGDVDENMGIKQVIHVARVRADARMKAGNELGVITKENVLNEETRTHSI